MSTLTVTYPFLWHFPTGVVMGASYVVIPSTFQEMETASDEIDQSDVNNERMSEAFLLFSGLGCIGLRVIDTLIKDNQI